MHKAPTAQNFKHQDIKQKEPPQKTGKQIKFLF